MDAQITKKREKNLRHSTILAREWKAGAGLKRAAAAPEERNPVCSSDTYYRHALFDPLAHALPKISFPLLRTCRYLLLKKLGPSVARDLNIYYYLLSSLVSGCRRDCHSITPNPKALRSCKGTGDIHFAIV
jgi:hypothetical protein